MRVVRQQYFGDISFTKEKIKECDWIAINQKNELVSIDFVAVEINSLPQLIIDLQEILKNYTDESNK